jgi:hypothetical protein
MVRTRFPGALYVHFENYRPGEIGFPNRDPNITLRWDSASGSVISPAKMKVVRTDKWAEDDALEPDVAQRFTFVFEVVFDGLDLFEQVNASRDVHVRVAIDNHVCTTMWKLTTKPNPYMTDIEGGNAHWLSTDLRTFQIQPGQTRFGAEFLESDSPFDFLDTVLDHFNAESNDSSPCSGRSRGFGQTRWNGRAGRGRSTSTTAIARCATSPAAPRRERARFFRMFNAVRTMLDYNSSTTCSVTWKAATRSLSGSWDQNHLDPVLQCAARHGQSVSADRQRGQPPRSKRKGGRVDLVPGCWLDINQTRHIATFRLRTALSQRQLLDFFAPVASRS